MNQSVGNSCQINGHPKVNFSKNHPDANNDILTLCVKAFLKAIIYPYYVGPILGMNGIWLFWF